MREHSRRWAFVLTLIARMGEGWPSQSAADMLPATLSALTGAGIDVDHAMPPEMRERYRWLLSGGVGKPPP